jgi:Protein of unknown function (DUF2459)
MKHLPTRRHPIQFLVLLVLLCAAGVRCPAATVYVARRGWHIDIGLAAADLTPPLAVAALKLPAARYLFFGFGDRHYLLAKRHNPPVLLAALWPGPGLMLVTGLSDSPDQGFGARHVISLHVSAAQMLALQAFVRRSLETREDNLIAREPGPYDDSVYFLAVPRYSALHTCNTWGAEALRSAGFRVHTAGVVFAGQLWSQAKRLKRAQSADGPRLED